MWRWHDRRQSKSIRIFFQSAAAVIGEKCHCQDQANADRPGEVMPAKQQVIALTLTALAYPLERSVLFEARHAALKDQVLHLARLEVSDRSPRCF